jgi:transcriptional regulator with XRE-family HTH domain
MWIQSTGKIHFVTFILSHYKSLEQIEFAELFEKLKANDITAIDVARELQTTPQAVSMWNKGKRNPRPLALEKLRAMVARICGPPSTSAHHLKETSEGSGENIWRDRAKRAEQELADLRSGLRELLARPSSKIQARADKVEAEIRSSGRSSSKQYPMLSSE